MIIHSREIVQRSLNFSDPGLIPSEGSSILFRFPLQSQPVNKVGMNAARLDNVTD